MVDPQWSVPVLYSCLIKAGSYLLYHEAWHFRPLFSYPYYKRSTGIWQTDGTDGTVNLTVPQLWISFLKK